jgi:hypothetical protein
MTFHPEHYSRGIAAILGPCQAAGQPAMRDLLGNHPRENLIIQFLIGLRAILRQLCAIMVSKIPFRQTASVISCVRPIQGSAQRSGEMVSHRADVDHNDQVVSFGRLIRPGVLVITKCSATWSPLLPLSPRTLSPPFSVVARGVV